MIRHVNTVRDILLLKQCINLFLTRESYLISCQVVQYSEYEYVEFVTLFRDVNSISDLMLYCDSFFFHE